MKKEALNNYIQSLTRKYLAIKSIWLIGSRANDNAREDSDWDLLVFADEKTLEKFKREKHNSISPKLIF